MSFKLKLTLILITLFSGLSIASFASAAFPTIAATNSNNTAASLSHTVNLPTGIVAGDLLVVSFSTDGAPTATFPAGWSSLFSTPNGTANRLSVAYKIADGTEGSSITVALGGSTSEPSAYTCYRITGHYAGIGPAYGTPATGSSVNPDPPSLTASWGAADTLWLAVYGWDYNRAHSAYPANYTLSQLYQRYNATSGCGIASAGYNYNTTDTQNPGTGTIGVADTWVANTLAVRPFVASTITLGSGTDPSTTTVAPGSGIVDAGSFTLQSSANPDYVTAMTVTLAGSGTSYNGISEVRITSNDGSVTYFSAVSNPASNTVNFSGGRGIPITSSSTQFKIRVTPKTHVGMDAPNGASYALSPYVSDWTLSYADTEAGSDSNANTLTIDNASPNGATSTSGTGGTGNVALNWTTSSSTDFSRSVVLRWASSTPGSEVPAEGTDYTAGDSISTATVACVRTADSAGTAITDAIDGNGGGGGCLTTALTNGTAYSYKVFQKDSNGNYDTGVTFTGSPFTPFSASVTQIYRSVGPGATGALATDSSHANTVTLTSGAATFSADLADNIGVGDAVIIDTGGTDQTIDSADTLLFISGRNSSTSYELRTHTGAVPANITSNDTWAIYRAYTSLYNAEAGTPNTSIPITFNGGNRDLVANGEQWNIACYANGTTADTTAVTVDGWTTDSDNFIKIYTPTLSTEVGVSQRHSGKWDDGKYQLVADAENSMLIYENYVRIEGLQISRGDYYGYYGGIIHVADVSGDIRISQNIVQGDGPADSDDWGIYNYNCQTAINIWNNIFYDLNIGVNLNSFAQEDITYVFNNTFQNCGTGLKTGYGTFIAKNNLFSACTLGAYADGVGHFGFGTDYNATNNSSMGYVVDGGGNDHDKVSQTFYFVDAINKDFHLAQSDTAARGAGANLTADANLPFSTDIDGQLRNPSGAGWDIGADEGTVEFVSTVMQSGGNFSTLSSWEDAIDSDLVADTTRVFSHGGITGTIVGGNTVTGLTSGATATVVYATSAQILLHSVSGIFQAGETVQVSAGNSVVISDNGNPASAVAKIDGAWTVADTTEVIVDGWISGPDNYIKVYTTPTARHSGKWDEGKYRIVSASGNAILLNVRENDFRVSGIQLETNSGTTNFPEGLKSYRGNIYIDSCIFRDMGSSSDYRTSGVWMEGGSGDIMYISNSVFYNWVNSTAISFFTGKINAYNNTIYNCHTGIDGGNILKNNIVQNCTDGYAGTFDASSDFNISDISGDAPNATFTGGFSEVQFVDEANEDFHLSQSDTAAKDAGTSLASDSASPFNTDIDGATRNASINAWDIGADETATQIFRSVAPGATGLLDSDNSHADELLSITSGVATFEVAVADNIGVGDVLIVDTNNDETITSADTLLFISGRNSSTSYNLRTHTGAVPANITSNDTWQIYRAHTSLANAEAGTINSTLSGMGFSFNGGNRDLLANNEEWDIACYANGTTADTTATTIDGWTTGAYNFLKVYTPVNTNEVGVSQRHGGKWDDSRYYMDAEIEVEEDFARFDGLQITFYTGGGGVGAISFWEPVRSDSEFYISNNIITTHSDSVQPSGIMIYNSNVNAKIWNNIIYDINDTINSSGSGIQDHSNSGAYIYNNTIFNCYIGTVTLSGNTVIKNNIYQNITDTSTLYNHHSSATNNVFDESSEEGAFGVFADSGMTSDVVSNKLIQSGQDFLSTVKVGMIIENTSDWEYTYVTAVDSDTQLSINDNIMESGDNYTIYTNRYGVVDFIDEANDDFHLSQSDTLAKDFGTSLVSDSILAFNTDIDGATRTSVTAWDIGADETATRIFRSVGPSATGLLTSDTAHARTVTLTSGVATFSVGLADNIGVGDAVIIDTGGTDQTIDASDTLLFIHSRTSSTSYTLRTHTGSVPGDIAINDTYSIYRAYTSLFNAEAGTKNTSIPMTFNGGNRDLVANNEEWNIACYANGAIADNTVAGFGDDWNTGANNYLNVYTPHKSFEVGISQRHNGKWDDNKYHYQRTCQGSWCGGIYINNPFMRLDGVQIDYADGGFQNAMMAVNVTMQSEDNAPIISNNIIRSTRGSGGRGMGIGEYTTPYNTLNAKIYNNIIYDFNWSGIEFWNQGGGDSIIYNNTIYNNGRYGITSAALVKNNLILNNGVNDFYGGGSAWVGSTNNASSDGTGDDGNLANGKTGGVAEDIFVNLSGRDFHLKQNDAFARQAGANLTADAGLPITTDIDGQLRNPSGAGWDIGADEGTVEFVSTVMQSGGNFSTLSSWEDAIDSDLVADTTRVFSHGGITGTIVGGNTVTGLTSGATATVVYATATQILLHTVSGIFQSGETLQVTAGNSVVISDNGNPASAVAKIDGAWSVADTAKVTIHGWVTGADNYIRIYTTPTARHSGKWDTGKYRLEVTATASYESCIKQRVGFIRYEGLQFKFKNNDYDGGRGGVDINDYYINSDFTIVKDNIFVSDFNTTNGDGSINALNLYDTSYTDKYHVLNNIFYHLGSGWSGAAPIAIILEGRNNLVSNNTIYYPRGIYAYGTSIVTNNIVQNSAVGYSGSFDASSGYNISNLNDAPGSNPKNSTTVSFISTTSGAEDFHLSQSDTAAKDAGTDLSTYFSTDIDGATRTTATAWDIGADETATQIFRSVGPSATALLASDNTHANTVTLTSGTATFSAALADNIGVGDAVIIDTGGTDQTIDASDTLLFIHGRTSSTVYTLRTHTGSVPTDITINDTWQIYRAHTSLSNAEAGTKNTSIPITFNGGNRDLLTNNEEWNIACYANGTTADTTATTIDGWTTGAYNFLKVYTPVNTNEVGVSQRHGGKWDDGKYKLFNANTVLSISDDNVWIDGLQVTMQASSEAFAYHGITLGTRSIGATCDISNNIVKINDDGHAIGGGYMEANENHIVRVWNNILIDFSVSKNAIGIYHADIFDTMIAYNNTLYGFQNGIRVQYPSTPFFAKNNITQNCTDGFNGTFDASSDYNISDIAGDAPSPSYRSGLATDVAFMDEANKDFHLSQSDTAAKNAGTDLSTYFTTDIDGATRTSVTAWDIGADETATRIYRSVGPSATGALANDGSHARNVTVTSGVATFSAALADNIGVGDAVIIDTGGTDQAIDASDTLLFIHSRTSSTSYTLRTHTGSVPGDISINDTYQIYRAYTSLFNAEAGTKNTSIPITFNGGNRDLLTNNEEWNIACYANGTTADTNAVDIRDWSTTQQNFVKVYTPVNSNEVGVSQRHSGKEDLYKYYLSNSVGSAVRYLYFDGLQLILSGKGAFTSNKADSYKTYISNCFMKSDGSGNGIFAYLDSGIAYAWNNIIIDFVNGISVNRGGNVFNNNTIIGSSSYGIWQNNGQLANNNLIVGSGIANYYNHSSGLSGYNNLSSDGTSSGTNPIINANVQFVNEAGYDFHLAQTDTAARGAGANLTADTYLPFSTDIDGQLRNPAGAGWDIGADEGTVEFVSTVMQSGGNFSTLSSWEDAIDSDLVADTTRVFSHGGITGTIVGGNTVTGLTSGATATVVYATSTQILLHTVNGIFQSGETVQVSSGNSVVISDNGNPASAVAKIDGAWSVADTTALSINGWITGADNYIRVYTTDSARHIGKWSDNKYVISAQSPVYIVPDNVTIDGLQVKSINYNGIAFNAGGDYYLENNTVSNNIVTCTLTTPTHNGIFVSNPYNAHNIKVFNNIVYNFYNGFYIGGSYPSANFIMTNNTAYGNESMGMDIGGSGLVVKNNISVNNNKDYDIGSASPLYSNNISSDATAPGSSGSKINAEVKFVSTEAGSEDFHLHPDDRFAIDGGTDLSTYFTTDIDGMPRSGSWDIGADETATQIYRSVGPSKTDTLDNDTGHSKNVTLTGGVATFSAPVPDNVGVGDVVIIDTDNDEAITSADTLLFIQKRNSPTSYKLQATNGSVPGDISVNDTYQIYRAYTSLANAEAGTINSTLSGMGFAFAGGNRDLVANNEQWNIACYANGTTADITSVDIDGWNTGENNFLKVYTPYLSSEVGVSQRHDGKWDANKYKLEFPIFNFFDINEEYVRVDGLQMSSGSYGQNVTLLRFGFLGGPASSDGQVSNSIFKESDGSAISILGGSVKVWNNILYNITADGILSDYALTSPIVSIYNNTVNACNKGINANGGSVRAKNNVVQDCTNGYDGTFDASSDYNISDLATDAPGTNSKNSTNVLFLDEVGYDFRLSSDDTAAKGAGLNLSTDTDLSFFDDIRGQSRPASPTAWSIGASEPQSAGKIKLEGTQIKMEGDAKFE